MPEYIEKGKIEKFIEDGLNNPDKNKAFGHDAIEIMAEIHYMPSEDVAPVVHGLPVLRYRPERYEWYEATGLNENGEPLYVKRVRIDEKSWAMYCPACGKRLCSRFNNYCPNCGAKMD